MATRAKKKKKRTPRAVDEERRELEALREARRNRFRILACIDGSDQSYETVRMAARLGKGPQIDIIILYVRPIDQGLRSGGPRPPHSTRERRSSIGLPTANLLVGE